MVVMKIVSLSRSRSAAELLCRSRRGHPGAAGSSKWRLLVSVAPLAILALASLCAALGWADVAMASPGAATSAALSQVVSGPADSTKLRSMQILATKAVSQISGQAISGAVDGAIADGFSDNPQLMTPNATDASGLADVATAPLVALDAWSARAVSGVAMSFAAGHASPSAASSAAWALTTHSGPPKRGSRSHYELAPRRCGICGDGEY
ncbi:hypothetical protein SR870_09140 [Rhodopseudomonas palustris]|uniref:hypothetical protein n=1 Tax=Rhodopseudomonas palustris TaxID=1076 RepID=UPI002ACDC129|nr:hypothetical protein [Rhodopseudomonas palustris]WQH01411.1 hypothetical protein SR870_09140 [Rhodopseudomonas palustris]